MKRSQKLGVVLFLALGGCPGPWPVADVADEVAEPVTNLPDEPGCDDDSCTGPSASCLFGETFYELRQSERLSLSADEWIVAERELSDPVEREQLIMAVRQSSHDDVQSVSEALSRVDEQEVRRIWLTPEAGGPTYVVYEYGAGDNSYGAFFAQGDARVLATIHDGDVLDCKVFE